MFFKFKNKQITQMISIIPSNIIKFEDEAEQYNFPVKRTLKMMDIMGYKEHRIFDEDNTFRCGNIWFKLHV